MSDTTAHTMSVRELRRRWKPIKEGAAAADEHAAIRVRLHRCWSWMQRLEQLDEADLGANDARLIYRWVALNSLYGQWDDERREPVADARSWRAFLERLVSFDCDQHIAAMLESHRELVKSIVGDEFLSRYYWVDPSEAEARRTHGKAKQLGSLYVEGRHGEVLHRVMNNVYLARCQLIHGAATCEGRLNRTAVERCASFMALLLPVVSVVIIDHAWGEDWGGLCYPPIDANDAAT
jgi:hypothetical protein